MRAKIVYGPSHGFAWFFTSSIKSLYTVVREGRKEAGLLHHLLGLIFIASDILLLDYDTKKERKGSLVMANDRKQSIDQD